MLRFYFNRDSLNLPVSIKMKTALLPKEEPKCGEYLLLLLLLSIILSSAWFRLPIHEGEIETSVSACDFESCESCRQHEANSRRLLVEGERRNCFMCCFPRFRPVPQEVEMNAHDGQLEHVDSGSRSQESAAERLVLPVPPKNQVHTFPLTNKAINDIAMQSHLLRRLRRMERSTPSYIETAMRFVRCAEPYWGSPLPIYERCYLNGELSHQETYEEYRQALLAVSLQYRSALQTRFPAVLVQADNQGHARIPFWTPMRLGDILDRVYDPTAPVGNNRLNWLAFSHITGRSGPHAYRFSVRFKEHVPRSVWMDVVFTFVLSTPDVEWFKIAPFEPNGKDDAVFAFMFDFDTEELLSKARPICDFWERDLVDSVLSKDLPSFQYNRLCKRGKVSWTTYHGGHSHGIALSNAFSIDARTVVAAAKTPRKELNFPQEYIPCLSTNPGDRIEDEKTRRSCVILTVDAWAFCRRPLEDFWIGHAPLFDIDDFDMCIIEMLNSHFLLEDRK